MRLVVLAAAIGLAATRASAQISQPPDEDHAIIFEIGAAAEGEPGEGSAHPGATFAFEVTPIEHWLEIEAGVSAIHDESGTEIPVDLLFKKPWRFSRTVEFMAGVGPEIIHATGHDAATYWGLSAVADFMIWPARNVGWYVEPGYEATFRGGVTHHGWAFAGGLLLGR